MLGRVHLLTDCRPGRDPVAQVAAALTVASADLVVQLRLADETSDRAAYAIAMEVAAMCRAAAVPLLINDRVDVALAVSADGVHLGADDLPIDAARRLLGRRVIGGTAREPASAARAIADGASYLGVGPTYATRTKEGLPPPIGLAGVAAVARAVGAPVLAIAGITLARVAEVMASGAHGVAVTAAVSEARDPAGALRELLAEVEQIARRTR